MDNKKGKKVKANNKPNNEKKEEKNAENRQITNERKTKIIIILVTVLVALAILIAFLMLGAKGDKNNTNNNTDNKNNIENIEQNTENEKFNNPKDAENVTEADIIGVYNFSKEDAKKMVMANFNSDNFEFYVNVSTEGKYIVTVRNTISEKIYKYEVDPAKRTFVEI